MDRVARELALDRAEVRRRNMIQPEQMPYESGSPSATASRSSMHSGDFPQAAREGASRFRDYDAISRAADQGARAGPLHRHRHRQLRRRHRPRPVRGRHRARAAPTARSRSRPAPPTRARAAHDVVADRRRPARLPDRGHRDDRRRHRCDLARASARFASRQAINAGSSAHDRRRERAQADRDARRAHARRAGKRHRSRGRPRRSRAAATSRRIDFGELARLAQGMPGFSFAPGQTPGPRAHRLFHAAAGVLLQRHACRRGRGRSDDRRRHDPALHASRTTAATSSIR